MISGVARNLIWVRGLKIGEGIYCYIYIILYIDLLIFGVGLYTDIAYLPRRCAPDYDQMKFYFK